MNAELMLLDDAVNTWILAFIGIIPVPVAIAAGSPIRVFI